MNDRAATAAAMRYDRAHGERVAATAWRVLWVSLAACSGPVSDGVGVGARADVDAGAGDDGPVIDPPLAEAPLRAPQCREGVMIPGPYGTLLQNMVDPHADVYGAGDDIGTVARPFWIGPEPRLVHIGWPSSDTSTSVSFVWATDRNTRASIVEWGEAGVLDHRSEGVSFGYGGVDDATYRVHELKLCDRLKPGTTYSYRVGGDAAFSPVYTFTTPPRPGSFDTFVVAYAGDARGDYETWAQMVARMETHSPDFYVFGGDMVSYGTAQTEWYGWFEAAGDVFARKVVVPAHGNHEYLAANYFALFSLPNNEQWYSVDYGNLTLFALNDTVAGSSDAMEFDQVDFIDHTLAESPATWRMAVHHQSTWSASEYHGSNERLRAWWQPAFDRWSFDAVLAGHDHTYERSHPIRGTSPEPTTDDQGTTYFVSGGAGAPLYLGHTDAWFNAANADVHHYLIGTFTSDRARWTAYDLAGNILDDVILPRRDR